MKKKDCKKENEKGRKGEGAEGHTCPVFVKPASANAPGSVLLPLVKPERERDT